MAEKKTTFREDLGHAPGGAAEWAVAHYYIDLHLVHEVTSPQAFDGLRVSGRRCGSRRGR